jgi:hypothetical protein
MPRILSGHVHIFLPRAPARFSFGSQRARGIEHVSRANSESGLLMIRNGPMPFPTLFMRGGKPAISWLHHPRV